MNLPNSFDSMIESKFLKKEDFPEPRIMTIQKFESENVAKEDEIPEIKWTIYFVGEKKPMVINSTNIQILKAAFGSPAAAVGQRVQVYVDPNVSFGGKLVGGLRLRGPSKKPTPAPAPAVEDTSPTQYTDEFQDDIPF